MVEIIFLMLVLKLPILYLAGVVYWAVKAEPSPPPEPALLPASFDDEPPPGRFRPHGPRRTGPDRRNRAARRAARLPIR